MQVADGDLPFAAMVVGADGKVLARVNNSIGTDCDPTAHAELKAIRLAAQASGRQDGLAGATLYASTEPCAMCASAAHWAGLQRIVFGLGGRRLREIYGARIPFRSLALPAQTVIGAGVNEIEIVGPLREALAARPHEEFARRPKP
jgi:tRNA(Arg) A34 adenosine deaminase TadA